MLRTIVLSTNGERSSQLDVQSNTFNGKKRIQLLIEIVVIWMLFSVYN